MDASIALSRYRITLEALERLDLRVYLGSTLRGAFGQAFKRLACPARGNEASPIPEICPYELLFNTKLPPDAPALRSYEEIPRSFVIAAPPAAQREYAAGSELAFDLVLIGRARQFLPYFVVTFREVDGLGRGRRAVRLRRIEIVHPLTGEAQTVYTAEENLRDSRPDIDYRGLIEQAKQVSLVRDETRWEEWARYSGRQGRRMEWGGFAGAATYDGDFAPFWPYLLFGQWTHVGKGATFGLGQYRAERSDA